MSLVRESKDAMPSDELLPGPRKKQESLRELGSGQEKAHPAARKHEVGHRRGSVYSDSHWVSLNPQLSNAHVAYNSILRILISFHGFNFESKEGSPLPCPRALR